MFISIIPMGKPRMTQRDRWKHRDVVERYHAFCDELRLKYKEAIPASVSLTFFIPMPASWSRKKSLAMLGTQHTQKPDIDNLQKAVFDAICADDSYIHTVLATKLWTELGGEGIEIFEL